MHMSESERLCTLEAATQFMAKECNGHAACVGEVRSTAFIVENSEGKRLDMITT